jgi:hypothetical protein
MVCCNSMWRFTCHLVIKLNPVGWNPQSRVKTNLFEAILTGRKKISMNKFLRKIGVNDTKLRIIGVVVIGADGLYNLPVVPKSLSF